MNRTRAVTMMKGFVTDAAKVADKGKAPVTTIPAEKSNAQADPVELAAINPYQLTILLALNKLGRHIYSGSVAPGEKARRRKANKVARTQRKVNHVR